MKRKPSPRTGRTAKVDWQKHYNDTYAELLAMRDRRNEIQDWLSQAQKERDEARDVRNSALDQLSELRLQVIGSERNRERLVLENREQFHTIAKRDIALADLNAELRSKDETIKEQLNDLNERDAAVREKDARIAELETQNDDLRDQRHHLRIFMQDCQLILATGCDMLCGTKFIQAGGLQETFKRYADRTALPPKERTT